MKKRTLLLTALALVTFAMAGCQTNDPKNSVRIAKEAPSEDQSTEQRATALTEEQAKEIAFQHANVNAADVKQVRVERDTEDGVDVIDVDFYAGNKEYDYEIDATTGDIRSYDSEIEDDFISATKEETPTDSSLLSKEEAIQIVLAKVEGATEKDVRISLETDDGQSIYEGEILYDGMEYDFEVHAKNGTILEWSKEREK